MYRKRPKQRNDVTGETRPHLQHLSIGFFEKELDFVSMGPYNIKRVIGAH